MAKTMVLRSRRPIHYGVKGGGSVWTGPVVRRDPTHYQRQADVGIRKCGNEYCRLWLDSALPRCPHCHTRQA